jgi:hypothetical protein
MQRDLAFGVPANGCTHEQAGAGPMGKSMMGKSMTVVAHDPYLEPTQAAGRAFVQRAIQGEIVMLNLLRFRDIANYSASPELAPDTPISGAAAFDRYIAHTLPYLKGSGGSLLFLGQGARF